MLDNASRFKIFWRVLLPLTHSGAGDARHLHLPHAWNDYCGR